MTRTIRSDAPAGWTRRRFGAALLLATTALAPGLAPRPVRAAPTAPAPAPAPAPLTDLGSTRRLEILPLVDWFVADPRLQGEAAVSYLVRSDHSSLLFDVGGNLEDRDPSPLQANMKTLGIGLDQIDTLVISHPHMDHVGGLANTQRGTFALGRQPADLSRLRIVVPVPLTYPGTAPTVASGPMRLAPGVASTGAIVGQIFIGPVAEQALAIRVEGRGIVLIVGCGHQGLPALLQRTAELFPTEPIHAVIGGLHYPVPKGRWTMGGRDVQRWASYGFGPGPTEADIQRDIERLQATGLKWIALSPHDSSDEVIERFRSAFGARYRDLRVGEPLRLGEP
jgi:7,8-dihydropterin-6-yl-methyl-4-(beta-D-ribofuranosyl)aminobenzene 5'-phosphate synthase